MTSLKWPRSRDSSVGIATRYWLDGPGIESRWGARFSAPFETDSEAHPASYTMGSGSFPWVKRPGRGVGHRPPSSAEVKERVEVFIYPPLGLRGLFWGEFYLYWSDLNKRAATRTANRNGFRKITAFWGTTPCTLTSQKRGYTVVSEERVAL